MSLQEATSGDASQLPDSPVVEVKNKRQARSGKERKKRSRSRSRVVKYDEDTDYSPGDDMTEEGSVDLSACSTPVDDKMSSHGSTPVLIVHPNSGTICAFCYCGEKSLLGQGDLTRYDPTPGFNPFRKPNVKRNRDSLSGHSPASDYGDRSSKSPSRSKSREMRHSRDSANRQTEGQQCVEVVEELSMLGFPEVADPSNIFESSGHVTAHHCCAAWSEGVTQNELYQLLHVDKAVHQGMAQKCSYCNRYGATIKCKASRCDKLYHYPCAAGSGCFQDIKSMLMLCPEHLEQAPSIGAPEELNCAVCDDMGEISDFLFCTSCGHHYHGNCLHPFVGVNPVVRAGWQCPDCKICQTCRQPGDDNKMLVCDSCDKGYHTFCLQPAIPFIPKNGWICHSCRQCAHCNAKSSNGSGSIWNYSEELCDKCYRQRTDGVGCPVCGKSYSTKIQFDDVMQCNACKKWVHEECEDAIDMNTYYEMGTDYTCPQCRNETPEVDMAVASEGFHPLSSAPPPPDYEEQEMMPDQLDTTSVDVKDTADQTAEIQPAKRSSVSSSLESDKSSSAMKGSSTDPMLFPLQTPTLNVAVSSACHSQDTGDEMMTSVSRNVHAPVGRTASADGQLVYVQPNTGQQDPLEFFSGEAFQPIVSVPILYEDQHGMLLKNTAEWNKRKVECVPSQPAVNIFPSGEVFPGQRVEKSGGMFGKGKPFGAKKKPATARSRGKGCSKGKGNRTRRQRPGSVSTTTPGQPSNVPSPTSVSTANQTSGMMSSSVMNVRRRTRNRLHRHESMAGAVTAADAYRDGVDEEYGDSMHNTVVLCSADDAFTLSQDICVVCGSFGKGIEGRLVVCSQCGQCYHPYCVNLKLTKVVLRKGWRCLDCTVCEECGAADDPSHLLLCDDCDISYHTYCLKPPLLLVPKGGWKCKWCVRCTHCGTTSPGVNCDWAENYTSCGPCASLTHCPVCRRSYRDEEIIMQCSTCERWLHSSCEYLFNESDIEKVLEKGYMCFFCRPKGSNPPHLDINPQPAFEGDPASGIYLGRTRSDVEQVKEYHKDGFALTSAGLHHIQQLMQNAMGLHKKKPQVSKRKSTTEKQAEKSSLAVEIKPHIATASLSGLNEGGGQQGAQGENNANVPESEGASQATLVKTEQDGECQTVLTTGSVVSGDGPASSVETPISAIDNSSATDMTKEAVVGVQQGGIKRRRKPYRPGIGGFIVRQRGRGAFLNPRNRRPQIRKGPSTITGVTGAGESEAKPPKTDDLKLRATEIAGENESSYIKHEMEGGITIAHQEVPQGEEKAEAVKVEKSEGTAQTSALVPPLKLKISTVAAATQPQQPKPKRKKRIRLIDQFPSYIQEGFFGLSMLSQAKNSSSSAIELFDETPAPKKRTTSGDSRIILPERIKLRLDAQVASKAAEAKKKAELKQERLHARRLPSGDEEGLMMDKESEDLLGVFPADLPYKDDELFGILSGSQVHGSAPDVHEHVLSPTALETLVSDGLASIDGDVTSLFSDVLNPTNETASGQDEHSLLGDIGNLTEQPTKTSLASDPTSSTPSQDSHLIPSSSAFDIDTTEAIIDQITAEHSEGILEAEPMNIKQEFKVDSNPVAMQQDVHIRAQHPQQVQLQQQIHLQQQQAQQLQHSQQQNFRMQPQIMPSNMHQMPRRMFSAPAGTEVINPSLHQHGQLPAVMPQQQIHMESNRLPIQQQQQQFVTGIDQVTAVMTSNIPPSMPMPTQAPEHMHSPGLIMRQHSVEGNAPVPVEMPTSQHRMITPSGSIVQMFTPHPGGASQPPIPVRPGTMMPNPPVPPSPSIVSRIEGTGSPMKQQTRSTPVSTLPDLATNTNIFEPAPLPWPLGTDLEGDTLSVNQRNILKWEKDEPLGKMATISPVLYANIKHPYLKNEFPDWPTRAKQVAKIWRKAPPEERAPFLQQARDNRALLKSTRRDIAEVSEQEAMELFEHEEDQRQGFQQHKLQQQQLSSGSQAVNFSVESHASQNINMQAAQQGMQCNAKVQDQFVKPRPLSRDPTPKPQSPCAATSPLIRSKSPFPAGMPPSQVAGTPKPRSSWSENQYSSDMQGSNPMHQPAMVAQPGWQNQQVTEQSMRMPKIENIDTSGMSSQTMSFPQSHSHGIAPGGPPVSISSPIKLSAPIQRSGSVHELSVMGHSPEQFMIRPIQPRPGVPPQLLSQAMNPAVQMSQRPVLPNPVSPHPMGHITPTPGARGSQPGTPQSALGLRDPFSDVVLDKPSQRRMSTAEACQGLTESMQMNMPGQIQVVPQSPGALRMPVPCDEKTAGGEIGDKAVTVLAPGAVSKPVREMLARHTTQRRYKILEQQALPGGSWAAPSSTIITRPPPPYPSQSPGALPTSQGFFVYSPSVRPERFAGPPNQLSDGRVRPPHVPLSPSFSPGFNAPNMPTPSNPSSIGVESYPQSTSATSSMPPVHPISGQVPVSPGYIELRHSRQPDPAVRREQIIRAGAAAMPVSSSVSLQTGDLKPNVSFHAGKPSAAAAKPIPSTPLKTPKPEVVPAHTIAFPQSGSHRKTPVPKTEKPDTQASGLVAIQQVTSSSIAQLTEESTAVLDSDGSSKPTVETSKITIENATTVAENLHSDGGGCKNVKQKGPTPMDEMTPSDEAKEAKTEDKLKSSELPQTSTCDAAAKTLETKADPCKINSENKENGTVNKEHSYVKATSSPINDTKPLEIESDREKIKTKETPNEQAEEATKEESSESRIRGVGLTPPPDKIPPIGTASFQDGQEVSNVVTVERENETSKAKNLAPQKKLAERAQILAEQVPAETDIAESKAASLQSSALSSSRADAVVPSGSNSPEQCHPPTTAATTSLSAVTTNFVSATTGIGGTSESPAKDETETNAVDPATATTLPTEVNQSHVSDTPVADLRKENGFDPKIQGEVSSVVCQTSEHQQTETSSSKAPHEESVKQEDKTLADNTEILQAKSGPISTKTQSTPSVASSVSLTTTAQTISGNLAVQTVNTAQAISTTAAESFPKPSMSTSVSHLVATGQSEVTEPTPGIMSSNEQISNMASLQSMTSTQNAELSSDKTLDTTMSVAADTSVQSQSPSHTQALPQSDTVTGVVAQGPVQYSRIATAQSGVIPHQPLLAAKQKKSLLIKEQPLLLQDLLEEEKKEQERARREKISQAMMQPSTMVYPIPGPETEAPEVDFKIMEAKMKFLSGITQVIKSTTTQAGPEGVSAPVQMIQHPARIGNWQHAAGGAYPVYPTDGDKKTFEEWLFQHEDLLQRQIATLEQTVKKHRSDKQALTKKQRQSKKSGIEFTQMEIQQLSMTSKLLSDSQKQLDTNRKDLARHSELVQDYNMKQETTQFMTQRGNGKPVVGIPQQAGEVLHIVQSPYQQTIPPHAVMRHSNLPGTVIIPSTQAPGSSTQLGQTSLTSHALMTTSQSSLTAAEAPLPDRVTHRPTLQTPSSTSLPMHQSPQASSLVQMQKVAGVRQMNPSQIQQFMIQHGNTHPVPSSQMSGAPRPGTLPGQIISGPMPIHLGSTPSRMPGTVEQSGTMQMETIPTQTMPAQVASVSVNVGSTMATLQSPMVMPGHQPSPLTCSAEAASYGQMSQRMHMEGQLRMPLLQTEEKATRKRKKPSKKTTSETMMEQHFVMAQSLMSEGDALKVRSMTNVAQMSEPMTVIMAPTFQTIPAASTRLTRPPVVSNLPSATWSTTEHTAQQPVVHVGAVSMSSSSGAAVLPSTPFPSATVQSRTSFTIAANLPATTSSATRKEFVPSTPGRTTTNTPVSISIIQHKASSSTATPFIGSTMPQAAKAVEDSLTDTCRPGLMVAQRPIQVGSIQKEIDPGHIEAMKASFAPHFLPQPPATPPSRFSGLSETEFSIILSTDPDCRSNATTPDTSSKPPSSPRADVLSAGTPDDGLKRSKSFQMDDRSLTLIEDTITCVIIDGLEYEERVERAKETGDIVVPPTWLHEPKPTKFPPKPLTPNIEMSPKGLPGTAPLVSLGAPFSHNIGKANFDMNSDQMKKQMQAMGHPYFYKMDDTGKKKRSRKSSKDQDGKEKVKRKRKKKQGDKADFPHGVSGPSREMMGAHMQRGFGGEPASNKPPTPWKPLPLLSLVEPDIKINYSLCMPKGTGLVQSKSLLEGTIGSSTLRGLPDYYDLLMCKDPLVYMNPPTPPCSEPPSPKRERLDSVDGMKGELGVYDHNVKVPDSLPTPPHQSSEGLDDVTTTGMITDGVIPPSSPELDDDQEQFSSNRFSLIRSVAHREPSFNQFHPPSPELPLVSYPQKVLIDEGDEVSVTISFKHTSSKLVKKSLSQLSRALGTSIVSFKLEDTGKESKEVHAGKSNADLKTENKMKTEASNDSTNADNTLQNRRSCFYCHHVVVGNGVRKPLFGDNLVEEDIIFCNKECFLNNEFSDKQTLADASSSKKKWKASQIYQRHTCRIDIASLISANPDPEYVSTRGKVGGSTSAGPDASDDARRSADAKNRGRGRRRGSTEESKVTAKRWKGIKWKKWCVGLTVVKSGNHKPPPDVDALLAKYGSALKPSGDIQDTRQCVLCGVRGDGDTKGVARLLNLDVDQWIHLNCALWSAEVYETQGGALINVDLAVRNGMMAVCVFCQKKGATIHCHRSRCTSIYHCACALECDCHFYKDKTVLCPSHIVGAGMQTGVPQHHDQQLKSLSVFRKVYVQRKETKQIASIMQQGELTQGEKNFILRVGALMFYAVGQLSTHQMALFHSRTAIYPVGYKATRIYWCSNNTRRRCKYECMITEKDGKPFFTTRYQSVPSRPKTAEKTVQSGQTLEIIGHALNEGWLKLLQQLANLRSQQKMLKLFPAYINGENIFGLTSPVVCRILESLPNIELCANYKFKYGRSPLLELPLAINPTGCARSEPHIKHSRKKPHTLISNLISEYYESTGVGDASSSLYGKHFVHSKSSQYRRMKQDWRNNVHLARSRIQGLGLFAGRDIEPGTMVIEYIGEIIRSEVAEKREKKYEASNRGVYMFRLDADCIVDATVTGGPARYINHSCNPNCVAEVVNFEKEKKIMIISNRFILSGEELHYDYKFDFEDDGNKIPCLCGATNCRKWMN